MTGMSRVRQTDFQWWRFIGGADLLPYQISFGFSLRYWPSMYAPSIRIHVGPFKLWLALIFGELR